MEMPRPRPPFLHYERLRHQRPHGQGVWYFRKGQGPRIRIRAPYGSSEFMEEYQRALTGELPDRKSVV